MSHHFNQYAHWLPSKAKLHLSHYFLASDVKNDPLIYGATHLVPFSNAVCLPEKQLSFAVEPFRKIMCNPVYFSLILSYISPNAFIGKEQK